MHSVVMILLKSLQSVTTPNCPRHVHTSTGISSLPTPLPHFIPLSALYLCLTDWARHTLVGRPVLGLSTRGFSSFISQLKYWPHRSLIFHQHLSGCTFGGSNLSNILSFSVPSRCDSVFSSFSDVLFRLYAKLVFGFILNTAHLISICVIIE